MVGGIVVFASPERARTTVGITLIYGLPIFFVIGYLLFLQAEVNDYYVKERQHLEKIKIKVGMLEQFDNYYFGENRFRAKNISFENLLSQFKKSFKTDDFEEKKKQKLLDIIGLLDKQLTEVAYEEETNKVLFLGIPITKSLLVTVGTALFIFMSEEITNIFNDQSALKNYAEDLFGNDTANATNATSLLFMRM